MISPAGPRPRVAVLSFILGILSTPPFPFSVLTGIPAILYGRKALHLIRTGPQPYRGLALARIGVALGYFSMVITLLLIVLILIGVLKP